MKKTVCGITALFCAALGATSAQDTPDGSGVVPGTSAPPKTNKLPAALLLAGKLLVYAAPVWQGCATTAITTRPVISPIEVKTPVNPENFTLEPYYIEDDVFELVRSGYGNIFGRNRVIMEVQGSVESLRSLRKNRVVSFQTTNMPRDMEEILRRYKTFDEYGDFYNYVVNNVDRVLLCPTIENIGLGSGVIYAACNYDRADKELYPDERLVYVNTLYTMPMVQDSELRIISDIIHEATHKKDGHITAGILNERRAYIMQVKFLRQALNDPAFSYLRAHLLWDIEWQEKKIEHDNSQLGLPAGDRALFPLAPPPE
jgi:hypothetical protein